MANLERGARRDDETKASAVSAATDTVRVFAQVAGVVFDPAVPDEHVRAQSWNGSDGAVSKTSARRPRTSISEATPTSATSAPATAGYASSLLTRANIWVDHSRRYRNPTDYLISPDRWERLRPEFPDTTGISLDPNQRLDELAQDLNTHLEELDAVLEHAETARIDDGRLVVPALPAEPVDEALDQIRTSIDSLLPQIDLVDLLVEVSSHSSPRRQRHHPHD